MARLNRRALLAASADGTTMLVTPSGVLTLHPHLFPAQIRYDSLVDFAPVTPLCEVSFALAVLPGHPARDVAGFVAWAKAQGGQIQAAVPPLGGVPPLHRDGRVRILGVTAARPLGTLPDVRTFADQGWRDVVVRDTGIWVEG